MISRINSFIQKHHLLPDSTTVILGLSGGPDSIFLLHSLAPLHHDKKINLITAHLNHEWRDDSFKDVEFCRQVAVNYNIPFVTAKASEIHPHLKRNGSQEEMGRKLRRIFLENVALEYNAQAIALGHHAQDQEETFFIRLIRGTSLSGLIGMRPQHGLYIRPLLETNKKDIIHYLDAQKIVYLIDPTNVSESYLRNRIRLNVMPELQKADQRFNHNFLRTVHNLQAAEQTIADLTHDLFLKTTTMSNGTHYLNLASFFMQNEYLQKRILVYWLILEQVPFILTDRFLDEIIRFFTQQESKEHALHATWSLVKEKGLVHLKKK
jgi:tRNA(Ile)-lysidine synthase